LHTVYSILIGLFLISGYDTHQMQSHSVKETLK